MSPETDEPGSPGHWLRHARSDLAYARLPLPPGGLLEMPCFRAQQAAEKAIKAVLVALQLPIPKTHNLGTLLEQVPPSVAIPTAVEDAVVLTDYAVMTRYPGNVEPITEDEYREAVEHAAQVVQRAEDSVATLGRST